MSGTAAFLPSSYTAPYIIGVTGRPCPSETAPVTTLRKCVMNIYANVEKWRARVERRCRLQRNLPPVCLPPAYLLLLLMLLLTFYTQLFPPPLTEKSRRASA